MDNQRTFLAIFLSLAILIGYQYFFVPAPPPEQAASVEAPAAPAKPAAPPATLSAPVKVAQPLREGRDIPVETSLYSAVVSEAGGMVKSFRLKRFREALAKDSGPKELVKTTLAEGLPLDFSWGSEPGMAPPVAYEAAVAGVKTAEGGQTELVMRGVLANGAEVIRILRMSDQHYLMELSVEVANTTGQPISGAPYLALVNRPFAAATTGVFTGPAALVDGALSEIKTDDLKKGSKSLTGQVAWAAYEDSYFMAAIVPDAEAKHTANFALIGEEVARTVLAGPADTLQPGQRRLYRYQVYMGPKHLETLKAAGHDLDRSVDFGWFDVMAKPTLYLLNFLHRYVGNYGVAIILVTILIKLAFWPIAQKGMESMKTMQKLQPKMAKLREKYKDDKARQQQEMMKLYQTYKVNPVGGCLPMLLQIPVFFALYKVLLMTIELRHAPFLLWITDLSAPDRLFIGFDIPFLGGIPVLTLLMGATMFLQQKMTPSSADPDQQKIMMFLPVIFTFMFLNFASGLVLYWFVNNLLSIGQQYLVNRKAD
ncbi:MAG: membrane protein insertase YidC [Thermodesulfobacteriota bacterium]